MEVVVGLDCGTSSTKAATTGSDGRVRDVASVGYPLLVPAPGRAEIDPRQLQAAALSALVDVVALARARGDVVIGVALCAAMHGLVPMAADGAPTGPLLTWADGRAGPQADALRSAGRARGLHARTGTPVHPMSPLVKLAWWGERDARLLRETPRWGGVKELLVGALCDAGHVVDLSCASATGLLDLESQQWDDEALAVAGVRPGQLPEVLSTLAVLAMRADVARAAGLSPATPVVVGAADGVLANLGVGVVRPGTAAVSIGTSAALRIAVNRPKVDDAGQLFCYALTADRWVRGGAVNNGGSVVRWAARALADGALVDDDAADLLDARLLEQAAAVAPGSDGLLCLPYLLGERAPWWRSDLRGAYVGLRREHLRPHLVRAAVEGVCQQLALVADSLAAAGHQLADVRATGGSLAAPLWREVLAAALDAPVRVSASPEGTARGACLLGLHALGRLDDLDDVADLVVVHEPVRPDPGAAGYYRRVRPLVEQAALALVDVVAALDDASPELLTW